MTPLHSARPFTVFKLFRCTVSARLHSTRLHSFSITIGSRLVRARRPESPLTSPYGTMFLLRLWLFSFLSSLKKKKKNQTLAFKKYPIKCIFMFTEVDEDVGQLPSAVVKRCRQLFASWWSLRLHRTSELTGTSGHWNVVERSWKICQVMTVTVWYDV